MDWAKLVRLNFDKNVGRADRAFRVTSGAALSATGWLGGLPVWQAVAMTALGVMWIGSGVLSRCSIYYMLGYSTCPVSGRSFERDKP